VKYRVRCDLAFDDETTARELWEAVKAKRPSAVVIKLGTLEEERPRGDLHRCYHDEPEPKPCEIIEEI